MSVIKPIYSNNGTACVSLPKKVLQKSCLEIGDNLQILYGKDKKCIILVGVDHVDIDNITDI